MKDSFEQEIETKESIQKNLQSSLNESERKLKNLTDALISELIDKEEYSVSKKQIKMDIENYRQKLVKL